MAGVAYIIGRKVRRRFPCSRSAVMAGRTRAAYRPVIHSRRNPGRGRVARIAFICTRYMLRMLARCRYSVMAGRATAGYT